MIPSEAKPGTESVAFRYPLTPSSGPQGVSVPLWNTTQPLPSSLPISQSPCPPHSSHAGLFLSFKNSFSLCHRVPLPSSLCLNGTCWGTSHEHPLMVAPPSQYTSLIFINKTNKQINKQSMFIISIPTSIEGPWKMTLVCLMDHCTLNYWNSAWHILGIHQILVNLMHA